MTPIFNESTKASELVPFYTEQIAVKTIVITGISPGSLGESFVRQVSVGKPAAFILAGRSTSKFQALVDNLANSHSDIVVKSLPWIYRVSAAQTVNSWSDIPHIDILVKQRWDYGRLVPLDRRWLRKSISNKSSRSFYFYEPNNEQDPFLEVTSRCTC